MNNIDLGNIIVKKGVSGILREILDRANSGHAVLQEYSQRCTVDGVLTPEEVLRARGQFTEIFDAAYFLCQLDAIRAPTL